MVEGKAFTYPPIIFAGYSIVVVYSVWDRVVRVRFPVPRQIQKTPILVFFCICRGKQANCFACHRESKSLSISQRAFGEVRYENCTVPVRKDSQYKKYFGGTGNRKAFEVFLEFMNRNIQKLYCSCKQSLLTLHSQHKQK